MKSPEWQEFWSTWTYKELHKPDKIICTDSFADEKGNIVSPTHYGLVSEFPEECVMDVTFEDIWGKTKMTLKIIGMPESDQEDAKKGWNWSFNKLEAILK